MFLRGIEFLLMLATFYLTITQIIVPLWLGLPAFPILRRTGILDRKLTTARGSVHDAVVEREITATEQVAKDLKG